MLLFAAASFGGPAAIGRERVWVLVEALLVAGAIVANLAFEEIGLDLVFVAAVAALALSFWRRAGALPLVLYFGASYVAGLAVTAAVKLL